MLHNDANCVIWSNLTHMYQPQSRSINARVSPEAGSFIERIAYIVGWSQSKIAGHIIERALSVFRKAYDDDDLLSVVRILRDGEFSVTIKPRVRTARRGGQDPQ